MGWLTLFSTILSASEKEKNKKTAKSLAAEAALCLDEAVKFFRPDCDLPDEGAFFTENSRRRFRAHPGHFAQSKWRERRLLLPDVKAAVTADGRAPRARWWQFWKAGPG